MLCAIAPSFVLANRVEAGLWIGIAIVVCVVARRDRAIAVVTFALFGVSDLVETTTGAWWRPWWLLMWKAACVAVFLWLLVRYHGRRARLTPRRPRTGPAAASTPAP